MKICVVSNEILVPSIRHITLEGNSVVPLEQAELVLADHAVTTTKPVITFGGSFPKAMIEIFGYALSSHDEHFVISRWFDHMVGWGGQAMFGVPVRGMMNDDLGQPEEVGFVSRFINSENVAHLFASKTLVDSLVMARHSGPVSIGFSLTDNKITSLTLGLGKWGTFNILEGVPTSLEQFLSDPTGTRLLESWVVSILVTRNPFPHQRTTEATTVLGLSSDAEKHFWPWSGSRFKQSFTTTSTILGVSTAWGVSLYEANKRALRTCRALRCDEIQYRTDMHVVGGRIWAAACAQGSLVTAS